MIANAGVIPLRLLDCLGLVTPSDLAVDGLCVLEAGGFRLEARFVSTLEVGCKSGDRRKDDGDGMVTISIEA